MKAPTSILVVGNPTTLDQVLTDKRVTEVLGTIKATRRPSRESLVIVDYQWKNLSGPELSAERLGYLFRGVIFGTACLVNDLPENFNVKDAENREDIRSDKDATNELIDRLVFTYDPSLEASPLERVA